MDDSVSRGIPAVDNVDTPVQEAIKLLGKMRDEELAEIHAWMTTEQNRRVAEAEEKLAQMRKAFGLEKSVSTAAASSKLTTDGSHPAKPKKAPKKATPKALRSPRGKARELIQTFLSEAPKGRKQIEAYFNENKLSTSSVGTLLNRLKGENIIVHDEKNKRYSLASETRAPHEYDPATPE